MKPKLRREALEENSGELDPPQNSIVQDANVTSGNNPIDMRQTVILASQLDMSIIR